MTHRLQRALQDMDIVIPVAQNGTNEELRYCLRAICQNVPHRSIFLVGYKPDWATEIEYIPEPQTSLSSRFARITEALRAATMDTNVSYYFARFDDDVFAVKPVTDIPPMHRGALDDHIALLERLARTNAYGNRLDAMQRTKRLLLKRKVQGDLYSYEQHVPMVMGKFELLGLLKLLERINPEGGMVHLRTMYANYYGLGGERVKDGKLLNPNDDPMPGLADRTYLSTSDSSWSGKLGEYIRSLFPEPCRYEQ